jgi:hypothetical protein
MRKILQFLGGDEEEKERSEKMGQVNGMPSVLLLFTS